MADADLDNPNLEELKAAAEPLIKYLSENYHPHTMALVDATHVEVFEGQMSHRTNEFLRD